jgi:hypothetical protein
LGDNQAMKNAILILTLIFSQVGQAKGPWSEFYGDPSYDENGELFVMPTENLMTQMEYKRFYSNKVKQIFNVYCNPKRLNNMAQAASGNSVEAFGNISAGNSRSQQRVLCAELEELPRGSTVDELALAQNKKIVAEYQKHICAKTMGNSQDTLMGALNAENKGSNMKNCLSLPRRLTKVEEAAYKKGKNQKFVEGLYWGKEAQLLGDDRDLGKLPGDFLDDIGPPNQTSTVINESN